MNRVTSIGVAAHELKSPLVLLRQLALELSHDDLTDGALVVAQLEQRVLERRIGDAALRWLGRLLR